MYFCSRQIVLVVLGGATSFPEIVGGGCTRQTVLYLVVHDCWRLLYQTNLTVLGGATSFPGSLFFPNCTGQILLYCIRQIVPIVLILSDNLNYLYFCGGATSFPEIVGGGCTRQTVLVLGGATLFPGSLFFPSPVLGKGRRENLGTRLLLVVGDGEVHDGDGNHFTCPQTGGAEWAPGQYRCLWCLVTILFLLLR